MENFEGHTIYHDLVITAPIDQVFKAVSEPSHLINWWPSRCKGIPKENEVYNFFFTPEYDWFGAVSKVVNNKSFHIKMTKSDPDWDSTAFGFDLEQKNESVNVRFSHSGWPACNEHFRIASFCWAMLLNGLKNYVEKGVIVPFENRS
ncbi:MAG: SRPBCC domain-containing protein [Marinoscillum sp.]